MKVDDAFHGITTLVHASTTLAHISGGGFFYHKFSDEKEAGTGPRWRYVEKMWLVTNRHIALPTFHKKEYLPDQFTFNLRKIDSNEQLKWEPITLSKTAFQERAKFHVDSRVDICVIDVLDLLMEKSKSGERLLQWYSVSKEHLPGNNNIFIEVADDIIIAGYPESFYDEINLYPIVKSGIIASKWGAFFNGEPCFLIDAKLFPGSSGSIVVSKPTDIAIIDGRPIYAKEKQFAFLGIFSEDSFQYDIAGDVSNSDNFQQSLNLGTVWYGHLVEEIIEKGVGFSSDS